MIKNNLERRIIKENLLLEKIGSYLTKMYGEIEIEFNYCIDVDTMLKEYSLEIQNFTEEKIGKFMTLIDDFNLDIYRVKLKNNETF